MTGPLQRIESLGNPVPPVRPRRQPVAAPAVPPAPVPDVVLACRFATASAALALVGVLRGTKARNEVTVLREGEAGDWWVTVEIDLELGRQFARMVPATVYVSSGGRLVRDPGFGPPPAAAPVQGDTLDRDALLPSDLLTLVRAAGVRRTPLRPVEQLHVLLDGASTAHVIRRAIDLGLSVRHRPVRLHPLFPGPGDAATMIELVLAAPRNALPPNLVTALSRDPTVVACRAAGSRNEVLIEHAVASPLADHLLASLVDRGTWVLATSPFGCRLLEPLGELADSTGLVRVADDYPIEEAGLPAGGADPALPAVRVVPRRTPHRVLDAVLFDDAELPSVRLLLEGDPLAETAMIVRGRDRHLLVAPGGVLERIPAGLPLYAVGPGPLYLPLGHTLRPHVPAAARRELFRADENRAVVLAPRAGWVFDLGAAVPVWELWVGDLPEFAGRPATEDLREVLDGLRPQEDRPVTRPAGDRPARAPIPWSRRRTAVEESTAESTETWHERALAEEMAGHLEEAARLHRRNGSLLRAARLYERAAELAEGR